MKISRRKLQKLISETLNREAQNEGMFDTIKSYAFHGMNKQDRIKKFKTSEDAIDLYDAMAGLGTSEGPIREIIKKRYKDLHKLYMEYNELIKNVTKAGTGVVDSIGSATLTENNKDLISWLEGDGMEEEARQVEAALGKHGVKRIPIPIKLKTGFFG